MRSLLGALALLIVACGTDSDSDSESSSGSSSSSGSTSDGGSVNPTADSGCDLTGPPQCFMADGAVCTDVAVDAVCVNDEFWECPDGSLAMESCGAGSSSGGSSSTGDGSSGSSGGTGTTGDGTSSGSGSSSTSG